MEKLKMAKKSLTTKILFSIIAAVLLFTFYLLWVNFFTKEITTFEECEKAGYPTYALSPLEKECKMPSGKGFVKSILIARDTMQKTNNDKAFCDQEIHKNRIAPDGWNLYVKQDSCISLFYPEDWNVLESLKHIGPFVAFSGEKIVESNIDNKITLGFKLAGSMIPELLSQSQLSNAEITSINKNSIMMYRIKGEVEDSLEATKLPYTYSDTVFAETDMYDDFYLKYTERSYSQKDREIFNKMVSSLRVGSFFGLDTD